MSMRDRHWSLVTFCSLARRGGVGQFTGRFLRVGDVVEAAIERIGELRNVVRMSATKR